jgi:hypothetical protein
LAFDQLPRYATEIFRPALEGLLKLGQRKPAAAIEFVVELAPQPGGHWIARGSAPTVAVKAIPDGCRPARRHHSKSVQQVLTADQIGPAMVEVHKPLESRPVQPRIQSVGRLP